MCRLYLDPPPGTVLINIDEMTGSQAKSRRHPQIPPGPDEMPAASFEYLRHGTVFHHRAINATTGEVIAGRVNKNDSAAFTRFLAIPHQKIPPYLRIHRICDNGSSHTSRATQAWLAACPGSR